MTRRTTHNSFCNFIQDQFQVFHINFLPNAPFDPSQDAMNPLYISGTYLRKLIREHYTYQPMATI